MDDNPPENSDASSSHQVQVEGKGIKAQDVVATTPATQSSNSADEELCSVVLPEINNEKRKRQLQSTEGIAASLVPESWKRNRHSLDGGCIGLGRTRIQGSVVSSPSHPIPPTSTSNGVSSTSTSSSADDTHPTTSCGLIINHDMFDDADDDETFDMALHKNQQPPHNPSYIRPDLVAAILGSPPNPVLSENGSGATLPIISNPKILMRKNTEERTTKSKSSRTNNTAGQRRSRSKKRVKNKLITDKEKTVVWNTILNDKIDLLRILPEKDCNFLGTECYIFTLDQLEWVLLFDNNNNNSTSLPDDAAVAAAASRQKRRDSLNQKLKQSHLITTCSTITTTTITTTCTNDNTHSGVVNEDEVAFQTAEKIQAWQYLIETWKEENKDNILSDVIEQFPLEGPISCLVPTGTMQFLQSINVKTAFDFFCLKKTENSLVVEMFRVWRNICGLTDMTLLSLSKHLSGINTRIETSLVCQQQINNDKETTNNNNTDSMLQWMMGAMVVLTGAAKEFSMNHFKVLSGSQFVQTKTKILADSLAGWRAKTGLAELKGSGTVAMVSTWKAHVKDELEIATSSGGEVISEEEIQKAIATIIVLLPPPPAGNNNNGHKKKKKTPVGAKLNTNNFDEASSSLDINKDGNNENNNQKISTSADRKQATPKSNPFDALSNSSKVFLATINISTASQFLATRTTDIACSFIKYREDKGQIELKGFGAVASISAWKKSVRKKAVLNGDLTLAHLNRGKNTKMMPVVEIMTAVEVATNNIETPAEGRSLMPSYNIIKTDSIPVKLEQ